MRKLFLILLFIILSIPVIAQDNHEEAYFYELRGMEDLSGVTHLFYRLYEEESSTCAAYNPETDDYEQIAVTNRYQNIFHLNTHTGSDSLQIENFQGVDNFCELEGASTKDIEFFIAHPDSFITYTVYSGFEANPAITDFKTRNIYLGMSATLQNVTYDPGNDRFIFGHSFITDNYFSSLSIPHNSTLWHQNYLDLSEIADSLRLPFWIHDTDSYSKAYIAQNEDSLFIRNNSVTELLLKDFPLNYEAPWDFQTFEDTTIIYSANRINYYPFFRNRSLLKIARGNPASVDTIKSDSYFEYSIDDLAPQMVFISDSLKLLMSTNFSSSFELLETFDSEITGLYKKPGSDILYVLTREELLEVNVETGEFTSLKQLSVSNEPETVELPAGIILHQNFPNPFNPSTNIQFTLPQSSHVKLEVFNSTGQLVSTLVDQSKTSGKHTVQFDASSLSSGLYFYRLTTSDKQLTRKFIFLK